MSNLIKGYSANPSSPYVIDADQSEKGQLLNEQVQRAPVAVPDVTAGPDGFQAGLAYGELSPEEYDNIVSEEGASDIGPEYVQDVEAAHAAALVLEEAYEEARQIRAEAELQVEDLKAQVTLQAKEDGKAQGLEEAAKEIEDLKQQLAKENEALKQQLVAEQEQALNELEPKFAEIVCDLLERLTGVTVKGHSEVILYLINNAMRDIENSHSFVISVSEADFNYVEQHKKEIYGYLNPGVEIELFQDPKLEKNQCKIETDNGLVDLSLDVQLSQLIKSLMFLNA